MKTLLMSFFVVSSISTRSVSQKTNIENVIVEWSTDSVNLPVEYYDRLQTSKSISMIHKLANDGKSLTQKNRTADPCLVQTQDQIYTGTTKGIRLWDGSARIDITTENSRLPENNITALAFDRDQNLLIGTFSSGMIKGCGKDIKPFKLKPIATHSQAIVSITTDDQGLVWVLYRTGCFECFENDISYALFTPVQKNIIRGIPMEY